MENKFQTVIKNIDSRTPPKKTAQIFFPTANLQDATLLAMVNCADGLPPGDNW